MISSNIFDDDIFGNGKTIADNRGNNGASSDDIPEDLIITDEFKACLDIMENTNDIMFITGKAGTGKSTLVKHFIKTTKKNVVVLAPTGVAAVNIGGQTIHSFFRFPPKPLNWSNIPRAHELFSQIYTEVDTIIIDEISMVRADLLDAINMFYELNFPCGSVFGGKQVIMVGDLSQLPPVVAREAEKEMMVDKYDSPFFFSAHLFQKAEFRKFKLSRIFRQKDQQFIDILNRIQIDEVTPSDITLLNDKCYRRQIELDSSTMTLCTTNGLVDTLNRIHLSKIQSPEIILEGTVIGKFEPKNCRVPERQAVKIGCKIMMLINDPQRRWHNGTTATLTDVDLPKSKIEVEIGDDRYWIERHEWENTKYSYNKLNKKIDHTSTGSFLAFPILLAYACSIHKSQGSTFDKVNIDLGSGSFAHGMTYVALSRCRTLEGITLAKKLQRSDIFIDQKVKEFLQGF